MMSRTIEPTPRHRRGGWRLAAWCRRGLTSVVIGCLGMPSVVSAGTVGPGHITSLIAHDYGVVFVSFDTPFQATPSCNTSGRFAISTHTPEGRALAAAAMLAKAAGSVVDGVGWPTPSCSIWPDAEDLQFLDVR